MKRRGNVEDVQRTTARMRCDKGRHAARFTEDVSPLQGREREHAAGDVPIDPAEYFSALRRLSVDKTQSGPDSGLTRDEARLFQRAEQFSTEVRKGTTPGFKAAAEIPISSYGTSPAATERFLQAACCQPYR